MIKSNNPVYFVAEPNDPTSLITLTADALEYIEQLVDNTLNYARKLKIKIHMVIPKKIAHYVINHEGNVCFEINIIIQPHNYDLTSIEEFYNRPRRRRVKRCCLPASYYYNGR